MLRRSPHALPLARSSTWRWHYRSRDERLIAFSNAHIYAPRQRRWSRSPARTPATACGHVLVEPRAQRPRCDRVVELVLEHAAAAARRVARRHHDGHHARRADRHRAAPGAGRNGRSCSEFFAEPTAEPFFVKNLERVQGDERDAIILSVGYGKNRGRPAALPLRPAEHQGRRAPAQRRHHPGPQPHDRGQLVPPRRHGPRPAAGRRRRAAARLPRVRRLGRPVAGRPSHGAAPTLNPFEADVRDRLTAAGIPLVAQYGVSGYRIDFAAAPPGRTRTGWCSAIETDGAVLPRLAAPSATATGCASSTWSASAGASTGSGPPTGSRQRETEIARAVVAYSEALAAPTPAGLPINTLPPETLAARATPRGPTARAAAVRGDRRSARP